MYDGREMFLDYAWTELESYSTKYQFSESSRRNATFCITRMSSAQMLLSNIAKMNQSKLVLIFNSVWQCEWLFANFFTFKLF